MAAARDALVSEIEGIVGGALARRQNMRNLVEGLANDRGLPPTFANGSAHDPHPGGPAAAPLTICDDFSAPPPPREWLVDGWLPVNRVAIGTGGGGGGKTKLALMLAHAVATGAEQWFDGGPKIDTRGPVLFVSWEDEADEIKRRLLHNPEYRYTGATALHEAVGGRLAVAELTGRGPLWSADNYGAAQTALGDMIQDTAAARGACLLVLDALDSAYAADENDRAQVRQFMAAWDAWGIEAGCTVLMIAHPPKSDAVYSGSTAWRNAARCMFTFTREDGAEQATLAVDKLNYGPRPEKLTLEDWHWWRACTPDPGKAVGEADRELQKALLDLLNRGGEAMSQRTVLARYRAAGGHAAEARIKTALEGLVVTGKATRSRGRHNAMIFSPSGHDD